jgi:hypothetical protein
MRKSSSVLFLSLCLVAIPLVAHHGPVTTVIKAAAKKQPPVPFTHEKHALKLTKTCDTCHHTQKGLKAEGTGMDVVKCQSCHLDPKDKAPSMREMSLTKNPFHVVCLDCHKKEKKGPTACTGCHVKK